MRTSRPHRLTAALAVALLAAPAMAQDDDPALRMLREQEALRDRQLTQVTGAFGRATEPLEGGRAKEAPEAEAPAPDGGSGSPRRWGPWVLGGLALAAGVVFVRAMRSAR